MTRHTFLNWKRVLLILFTIGGIAVTGYFAAARGRAILSEHATNSEQPKPTAPVTVEVVIPKPGGIDRVCVQPGTVEPFQAADLFAKVSGFLAEQLVDINSRVNKGDVLARIAVPEFDKQIQKDTADVRRAEAKLAQANAAVATAEAELGAAVALIALAQAEAKSKASYKSYRSKQRDRLRDLLAQRAIDAKLVDEQEDQYEASVAAMLAAEESVSSARQKAAAARANVEQAKADQKYAEAEIAVAQAQLAKSQVLLDYAIIRSPYTGIVTRRNFHPGDFIKSADHGGSTPLLTVERTDMVRVVVQVPDRDVPFVSLGDPARVEIDALPGVSFVSSNSDKVVISRWSNAQDQATRTMRTEIDLKNVDGRLRHGMYGRVTLTLQTGTPSAFRLPSSTIVTRSGNKGTVRVIRDQHIRSTPVTFGADNGVEVEVLAGLTAEDRVVVRSSGPVNDNTPVVITGVKTTSAY